MNNSSNNNRLIVGRFFLPLALLVSKCQKFLNTAYLIQAVICRTS